MLRFLGRDTKTRLLEKGDYLAMVHVKYFILTQSGKLSLKGYKGHGFCLEYKSQRFIVTAAHLFAHGAFQDKILVSFPKKSSRTWPAKLVGYSIEFDTAILKITDQNRAFSSQCVPATSLVNVKLRDRLFTVTTDGNGRIKISEGNAVSPPPDANLEAIWTVKILKKWSSFIISANIAMPNWIVHSCAVVPGDSGSPLVNENGEIVGMNVVRLLPTSDSFAISIKNIMDYVKEIA